MNEEDKLFQYMTKEELVCGIKFFSGMVNALQKLSVAEMRKQYAYKKKR